MTEEKIHSAKQLNTIVYKISAFCFLTGSLAGYSGHKLKDDFEKLKLDIHSKPAKETSKEAYPSHATRKITLHFS